MQTLTLSGGRKLRYYDSLDQFPAERRSYFTRYLIESSELPKTPEEFTQRLSQLMQLAVDNHTADLLTGLQNLAFAFNAVYSNYAPDELAFGAIVHDVDGVLVTDLTPDGLRSVLQPLQIPTSTLAAIVSEVKKNWPRKEVVGFLSLGMLSV